MKFPLCCTVLLGVLLLFQLAEAVGEKQLEGLTSLKKKATQVVEKKQHEENQALKLQIRIEHLIEKIISYVQDFYMQIEGTYKCIPDYLTEELLNTLKRSIECVADETTAVNLSGRRQHKNFMKCFTTAKKEVESAMKNLNFTENICPENVTVKTYQVNVTTTFTKTFNIQIKNGVEVTKKQIELQKDTKNCFGGWDETENELEDEDKVPAESTEESKKSGEEDSSDSKNQGEEGTESETETVESKEEKEKGEKDNEETQEKKRMTDESEEEEEEEENTNEEVVEGVARR